MNVSTRQGYLFEDLEIGMEASFAKSVSETDIATFAEVTGDKNPVHLDEAYAAKTIFKRPIAGTAPRAPSMLRPAVVIGPRPKIQGSNCQSPLAQR